MDALWLRSSRCESNECVLVARDGCWILVADAKDPGGLVLSVDSGAWSRFLGHLRNQV